MNRSLGKLLIFALIIGLFVGGYFYWRSKSDHENRVPIRKIDMKEAVYGIGTLTANNVYQLKVPLETSVNGVYKREGEEVKKGDALVALDGFPTFRSPFAGTLTTLGVRLGENVAANTPILTVTDLHDIYLAVRLEQSGVVKVRVGQLARISFDALKDQAFTGQVRSIYPSDGDFIVQVTLDNLLSVLLPGMTADVAVEVGQKTQVLAIPSWALTSKDQMTVVSKNGARKTLKYKPGITSEEMVEIRADGLSNEDAVVTTVKPPQNNK